jgi:hypothetical protein
MDTQDGQAADLIRPIDQHLAIEPAGPQEGRIRISGRLVAAIRMTAMRGSKPSISTSN